MEEKKDNIAEEKEIDLLALGKKLWQNKIFIFKVMGISAVVGLVVAFSIPKEYTTKVILKTDSAQSSSGNMSALASMAGINLGSSIGDDILSPDLYPDVLNSTPFIQGLFNINVSDSKQNINTTVFQYFKEEQKVAWWSYIIKALGALMEFSSKEEIDSDSISKNKRSISKNEMDIISAISSTYSITTDKKTGVTTLDVTTQSPSISAFLADTITSYLQSYIIEQRTKKAKTDLENSEKLYNQAKDDYYKAQQKLAAFVDGNMNVISAKYKVNQEKLQNEASIAYTVYNQMAQQVQMNKIKVQDDTPMFTIIQPAVEPLLPSKPSKKMILIGFVFLAFIGSSAWTLKDSFLETLKY